MKLEWSHFALNDREIIFDYVEAESPRSAVMIDETIETTADQLIAFPETGRVGRIAGTRELIVTGLPYIIAYRAAGNVVRILRVLHTAQKWPEDLEH